MNNSSEPLVGKRAFVVGGSRGIGAAIVKRLAAEGAAVAFTYVSRPEAARDVVAAVEAAGGRAQATRADSADAAALERAIDEGAAVLGGLDVVVYNAGLLKLGPVDAFALEDFDAMFAVNVRGAFVTAKAGAKHLPRGGKVIFIGSNTAEHAAHAGSAVYGTTKAAVARLVRGLAWDLAPRGIAAINVQPGPTTTDMNPADGAHVEWTKARSPEHRAADPDEIARLVAYLARPESTYINGASLTIDGGFSA